MSKCCTNILEPHEHFRFLMVGEPSLEKPSLEVGEGGHIRELRVGLEPLQSEGSGNEQMG